MPAALHRFLRGSDPRQLSALRSGPLTLDPIGHTATLYDESLDLTQTEFALLQTLMSEPAKLYSRVELVQAIWGTRDIDPVVGSSRALDAHISRLRRKLAEHGAFGFVRNVWGAGFRLV